MSSESESQEISSKKMTEMGSSLKQDRGEKTSHEQYSLILEFVEKNPIILVARTKSTDHKNVVHSLWIELSDILNKAKGPTKPMDRWVKAFIDWKYSVNRKAEMYNQWREGQGTRCPRPLSELEEKLLSLLNQFDELDFADGDDENENPQTLPQAKCSDTDPTLHDKTLESYEGQSPKTTPAQYIRMIEFMEKHPGLATGKMGAHCDNTELWTELVSVLNAMEEHEGKSMVKWMKVWSDWKYQVKNHAEEIAGYRQTRRKYMQPLTDLEKKLISVTGFKIGTRKIKDGTDFLEFKQYELPPSRITFKRNMYMLTQLEASGDTLAGSLGTWAMMTDALNTIDNSNRTPEQWKKIFTDWKYNTTRKQRALNKWTRNSNNKKKPKDLNEMEQRLMNYISKFKDDDCNDEDRDASSDESNDRYFNSTSAAPVEMPVQAIQVVCRVCLNNSESLRPIFAHNSMDLANKMMLCANVQIKQSDGLPDQICLRCINLVDSAWLYKTTCETSDIKLRSSTKIAIKQDADGQFVYVDCFNDDCESIKVESNVDEFVATTDEHLDNKILIDLKPVKSDSDEDFNGGEVDNDYSDNDSDTIPLSKRVKASVKVRDRKRSRNIAAKKMPVARYRLPSKRMVRCARRPEGSTSKEKEPGTTDDVTVTHQCELCGMVFKLRQALSTHMKTHSDYRPFTCDVCSKGFRNKMALQVHQRIHTGERPYVCEVCGRRFTQEGALAYHRLIHTGQKEYQCPSCPYMARSTSNLVIHSRHHSGARPFPCTMCDKRFTTSSNLQKHKRRHLGLRTHKICGRGFSQCAAFHSHRRIHSNIKSFSCETCGYKVSNASDLKKHIRRHTGDRPYTCELCGFKFTTTSNLQKHKRYIHEQQRNHKYFSCDKCDYKVIDASDLKKHMRKHTGERPYPCLTCGYKFTTASNLQQHKRYIHEKQRNHKCEQCSREFYSSVSVRKHMVSHTGARNFPCPLCPLKYGYWGGLKRHCKKQHPGYVVTPQDVPVPEGVIDVCRS